MGVFDPSLDKVLDPESLAYLREVAGRGVDMKYEGPRETVRAKLHASAAARQGEAYEKVWDDVACGRVLLTFADAKGLEGLVSSPQGRGAR